MTDREEFENWLKDHINYDYSTGIITVKKSYIHKPVGSILGFNNSDGYLRARFKGKRFLIHRMAWFLGTGKWPTLQIDHINGCRIDNRLCNLREATHSQNCQNSKKPCTNKSGVKGVYLLRGKYRAEISISNKTHVIGTFETLDEATIARRNFADITYKEFSNYGH